MGVVRDPTFLRQRVGQVTVQGIMIGTIFWQTDQDALKVALFFMFTGEMRMMFTLRHTLCSHSDASFPTNTVQVLIHRAKYS
jgi:hypothetical protein